MSKKPKRRYTVERINKASADVFDNVNKEVVAYSCPIKHAKKIAKLCNACGDLRPSALGKVLRVVDRATGANQTVPDFLDWIADRMVHEYNVDERTDYILKLKEISTELRHALSQTVDSGSKTN